MKNIHLFTNNQRIIKVLSFFFNIKYVFTENKNLKNINKHKIKIKKINSLDQISNKYFTKVDLGISFGFGLVFKKKIIQKYRHGIWNIHSGDLPKYRGRHPITSAFLNDEKKIGLSIHIINEKIDQGLLLAKRFVNRTYQDDEKTIINKIFKILQRTLSLAIKNYKLKKYTILKKGTYYKPFYDGITITDSSKENYLYVYNAIKAQKAHNGAKINNQVFFDAFFINKKKFNKKCRVLICKNKKKIIGVLK